jgi:hypothetical protein
MFRMRARGRRSRGGAEIYYLIISIVKIPCRSKIFFSYPKKFPDRLWGPHSLLISRYWKLFPGGKVART